MPKRFCRSGRRGKSTVTKQCRRQRLIQQLERGATSAVFAAVLSSGPAHSVNRPAPIFTRGATTSSRISGYTLVDECFDEKADSFGDKSRWSDQDFAVRQFARLAQENPVTVFGKGKIESAFADPPSVIWCIDGRRQTTLNGQHHTPLGVAAGGLLMNSRQQQIFSQRLRRYEQSYGLKLPIIVHEDCGAGALYCQQHFNEPEIPHEPIMACSLYANQLSESLGHRQRPLRAGFSEHCDIRMTGRPGFHHERFLIIDGSGRIDPKKLGAPASFLCSAYFEGDLAYTKTEVGVAMSIAFGPHGYGLGRFRDDDRLIIVIVGHPTDQAYSIAAITKAIEPVTRVHQDHLKVVAFTAPQGIKI